MDIDLSKAPKGWAQKTYQVSFACGTNIVTHALDRDDAQELAIDHLERLHVVPHSIVSIRVVA